MKRKKGIFQKVSLFSAAASFAGSFICGIFLYLRVSETGYDNPISASLLASVFFFSFMGILLTIIGNSDIPSFKLDASEKSVD